MNNISLSGVIVREPELRFTAGSGKAVCTFTLAVKKAFKPQNGSDADFIECQLWGKQAESFAQYNDKGARVAVTGELNDRNYEDKQGVKQYRKIVNCNHWEFNGSKKEHDTDTNFGDSPEDNGFQSIEDEENMDSIPF